MKTGEHGEDCDLVAFFPWLSEFGCSLKLACRGKGLRRNGGTQLEDLKAEIFTTSFDHIYSNSLTSLNMCASMASGFSRQVEASKEAFQALIDLPEDGK